MSLLFTCQELHDVFSEKIAQILKTINVNKLYLMVCDFHQAYEMSLQFQNLYVTDFPLVRNIQLNWNVLQIDK